MPGRRSMASTSTVDCGFDSDLTRSGILATAGNGHRNLFPLTLTAIGVVYGDIGTSPLYALRECFYGSHSVPPTQENVLGVLSLIIYSLLLVISVKYIAIVMRADNQGEGGILALTALLPAGDGNGPRWPKLVLTGVFGAALLYGDGMITPAITVLGAVEGLTIATPLFQSYVVPITVAILIGVFAIQKYGTHRVGGLFGPIMVAWFLVLAVMGVSWLVEQPVVLTAIDPRHAVIFFRDTAGMASPCSAPSSSSSPAAKRSMPTWGTSGSGPSASRGSGSCCHRCC